jgi:hypothetical protein
VHHVLLDRHHALRHAIHASSSAKPWRPAGIDHGVRRRFSQSRRLGFDLAPSSYKDMA